MQTHYYNAYNNEKLPFIEETAHPSYAAAVADAVEMADRFPYTYTLEISTNSRGATVAKVINAHKDILEAKYGEDNERLTGHEMGLTSRMV